MIPSVRRHQSVFFGKTWVNYCLSKISFSILSYFCSILCSLVLNGYCKYFAISVFWVRVLQTFNRLEVTSEIHPRLARRRTEQVDICGTCTRCWNAPKLCAELRRNVSKFCAEFFFEFFALMESTIVLLQEYGDRFEGIVYPRWLPYDSTVPHQITGDGKFPAQSVRHGLAGQTYRGEGTKHRSSLTGIFVI